MPNTRLAIAKTINSSCFLHGFSSIRQTPGADVYSYIDPPLLSKRENPGPKGAKPVRCADNAAKMRQAGVWNEVDRKDKLLFGIFVFYPGRNGFR